LPNFYRATKESVSEALRLFLKAIELDPEFASAYGMAAWCYVWRKMNGWTTKPAEDVIETTRLARRATESGRDDAVALCCGGYALAYVARDVDGGVAFIDQALALNPNLAVAWNFSGWVRIFLGEHDAAIERLTRAMRLSPLDPALFHMRQGIAYAHLLAGRYDEASSWAKAGLRDQPNILGNLRVLAASKALGGQPDEAGDTVRYILQLDPAVRISNLKDRISPLRPSDLDKYVEGLRKAGLPE
jgi:tetratricopeptide (TPR) repeat protein